MNRSYSKIRHIQESNQRLERRLLTEKIAGEDNQPVSNGKVIIEITNQSQVPIEITNQSQVPIEITNQSQVPQSLVDSPPPVGYYHSNRGTYDKTGQYIEIKDEVGVTYRLRTFDFNLGGQGTKGIIEAEYNSSLSQGGKDSSGKELVTYFNGITGSEVVPNNKDKWIGFTSDDNSIKFACFSDKTGIFSCKTYKWGLKK